MLLSSSTSAASPAASPAANAGPAASVALAPNVYSGGGPNYLFSLTYADSSPVDPSSLGNANVKVRGTNGFSQPASLVTVAASGGGTSVTAIYSFVAPGGAWDPSDSATYSLVLQPSQVRDAAGAFAPAGTVGSFQAAIAGVPLQPYLMPAGDTGVSSHDQITSLDNASPARVLQFDVGGTLPGRW